MNKFTYIRFLGLGVVLAPIMIIVISMLIFLLNNIDVSTEQSQIPRVETRIDTVIVRKTVTDTVRIKVYEKVYEKIPTPTEPELPEVPSSPETPDVPFPS